ncbi:MAG TPA: hypothetical protein VMS31_12055 [Pyrinomonadaceae bacterium]|nr:hypothetical protein [Pyrinomonadaceae bacterium]
MTCLPLTLDAISAFRRLAASVEFALSAIPKEEEEEVPHNRFTRKFHEICDHLEPRQRNILLNYADRIAKAFSEATSSVRQGQNFEHKFNLEEIEDPEVRAAVIIAFMELDDETSLSSPDQFHVSAAAIGLVSAFEVFCTELLRGFFTRRPEAILGSPSVPLSVVVNADSVKQVIREFAQGRAREMVFAPIDEWLPLLAKHCGIELHKKPDQWREGWRSLCWLAARRNSIIHTGGIVDNKLKARAERIGYSSPDQNDRVLLTAEEVRGAAYHTIQISMQLLFGLVRRQTEVADRHRESFFLANSVASLQLALIDRDMPQLAYAMRYQVKLTSNEKISSLTIAQWTILIAAGHQELVRSEASKAQWPDKPIYKLHKEAILGTPHSTKIALANALNNGLTMVDVLFSRNFYLVKRMLLSNPEIFAKFNRLESSDILQLPDLPQTDVP